MIDTKINGRQLTPRMAETLELVADGLNSEEIAEIMKIRPKQVNFNVHILYMIFEVSNRVQLARIVWEHKHGIQSVDQRRDER